MPDHAMPRGGNVAKQQNLLYEVYERAVRSNDRQELVEGSSPKATAQIIWLEASSTLVVYDALVGDLIFFQKLDDFAKPKSIFSLNSEQGVPSVYGGENCVIAVTEAGGCSVINPQGELFLSKTSSLFDPDVVFVLPVIRDQQRLAEVLSVRSNATIEIRCLGDVTDRKRKVVSAAKYHNTVVGGAYNSRRRILCVVGSDTQYSLESVSVWALADEDSLRFTSQKPVAHYGVGQNFFRRHFVNVTGLIWTSLGQTRSNSLLWKISISPLAESVSVKPPDGPIQVFAIKQKSIEKSSLADSIVGDKLECHSCNWWSEETVILHVGNQKMVIVNAKERKVIYHHTFNVTGDKGIPFHFVSVDRKKMAVLTPIDSETSIGWRLHCLAHHMPEEMLHSHLAKNRYDEATVLAQSYGLNMAAIHKMQWLHSDYTLQDISTTLSRIDDKFWVIDQCILTICDDVEAQRSLLQYGVTLLTAAMEACDSSAPELRSMSRMKIRLLRYLDCLETVLMLFNHCYYREVYREFRDSDIRASACLYAQTGNVDSLQIMFQRHPCFLIPDILLILSSFPESMDINLYSSILGLLFVGKVAPLRADDASETAENILNRSILLTSLGESGGNVSDDGENLFELVTDNVYAHTRDCKSPDPSAVESWLSVRTLEIMNAGQIANTRRFIEATTTGNQLPMSPGRVSMNECLFALIDGMTLGTVRWDMNAAQYLSLDQVGKFRALLGLSTEKTVGRDLVEVVVPFVRSRINNGGSMSENMVVPLLKVAEDEFSGRPAWAMAFLSQICTNTAAMLGIDNKAPFVLKALELVNSNPDVGCWAALNQSITELLGSLSEGSEQDEIVEEVKSLSNIIQCARIMEKHGLHVDLLTIKAHSEDEERTRMLLRQLLSNTAQQSTNSSVDDELWEALWGDVCTLRDLAFQQMEYKQVLLEFCRALLESGRFFVAETFLDGKDGVTLDADAAEGLVISVARDLFYSSENFSSLAVEQAKQCLLSLPDNGAVRKELDFISSLENVEEFGLNLRPCDIRHISGNLEIISMILRNNPKSYKNVKGLTRFANAILLNSETDDLQIKLEVAKTAFLSEKDFSFALDMVPLFLESNFAPSAGLITEMVRDLDPLSLVLPSSAPGDGGLDAQLLSDMVSFALCYCSERDLHCLLAKARQIHQINSHIDRFSAHPTLKARAPSPTSSVGSLFSHEKFWLDDPCASLFSLVSDTDADDASVQQLNPQAFMQLIDEAVSHADRYEHAERSVIFALAASALKVGISVTDSISNAFCFKDPKDVYERVRSHCVASGKHDDSSSAPSSFASVASQVCRWMTMLWDLRECWQALSGSGPGSGSVLKVGSFLVGDESHRREALVHLIRTLKRSKYNGEAIRHRVWSILCVATEGNVDRSGLMRLLISNLFAERGGDWGDLGQTRRGIFTSDIIFPIIKNSSSPSGSKVLSDECLAFVAAHCAGEVYAEVDGLRRYADLSNLLAVIEACYHREPEEGPGAGDVGGDDGNKVIGTAPPPDAKVFSAADLVILRKVLALLSDASKVSVPSETNSSSGVGVDFKRLIVGGKMFLQEVSRTSITDVDASSRLFVQICNLMNKTMLWRKLQTDNPEHVPTESSTRLQLLSQSVQRRAANNHGDEDELDMVWLDSLSFLTENDVVGFSNQVATNPKVPLSSRKLLVESARELLADSKSSDDMGEDNSKTSPSESVGRLDALLSHLEALERVDATIPHCLAPGHRNLLDNLSLAMIKQTTDNEQAEDTLHEPIEPSSTGQGAEENQAEEVSHSELEDKNGNDDGHSGEFVAESDEEEDVSPNSLGDALGAMAWEGVDVLALVFAAFAHGVQQPFKSVKHILTIKTKKAVKAMDEVSPEGDVALHRLIRCLEAKEQSCVDNLASSHTTAVTAMLRPGPHESKHSQDTEDMTVKQLISAFVEETRSAVWGIVRSEIVQSWSALDKKQAHGTDQNGDAQEGLGSLFWVDRAKVVDTWTRVRKSWGVFDESSEYFGDILLRCRSSLILNMAFGGREGGTDSAVDRSMVHLLRSATEGSDENGERDFLSCFEHDWIAIAKTGLQCLCLSRWLSLLSSDLGDCHGKGCLVDQTLPCWPLLLRKCVEMGLDGPACVVVRGMTTASLEEHVHKLDLGGIFEEMRTKTATTLAEAESEGEHANMHRVRSLVAWAKAGLVTGAEEVHSLVLCTMQEGRRDDGCGGDLLLRFGLDAELLGLLIRRNRLADLAGTSRACFDAILQAVSPRKPRDPARVITKAPQDFALIAQCTAAVLCLMDAQDEQNGQQKQPSPPHRHEKFGFFDDPFFCQTIGGVDCGASSAGVSVGMASVLVLRYLGTHPVLTLPRDVVLGGAGTAVARKFLERKLEYTMTTTTTTTSELEEECEHDKVMRELVLDWLANEAEGLCKAAVQRIKAV